MSVQEEDVSGYAQGQIDEDTDIGGIVEILCCYETALTEWRELREQIALMLPGDKQQSYREITRQMHARLYDDLSALKDIKY